MNITEQFFGHKKVIVFGLGTNGGGLGTVQFLLGTKAEVIHLVDQKSQEELENTLRELPEDARLREHFALLEGDLNDLFSQVDVVIKNPGIRWDHPLIVKAKEYGAEVLMDSTIFMALCPAPVIGVTGSKGKTTTASLIAHILEEAGQDVVQVGVSQTGVLSELSRVTSESVVVFELSSWRLSGLFGVGLSPKIAVITNLYPDHLNYYDTMEEYAKDKKVITCFQKPGDVLIVPEENEWTEFFTKDTKASVRKFGGVKSAAWQTEKSLVIQDEEGDREVLQKKQSLLQGAHLFDNMLAATLATRAFGVSYETITKGLQTFNGVAHRFEFVREIGGVRYINDTAATIPSAALAAVRSVGAPVILLAGGSDKGLPLTELLEAIESSKYTILFSGSGTDKILQEISSEIRPEIEVVRGMKEAVEKASKRAEEGDVVLLAPGAASFGMFKNEFDRGEKFMREVREIQEGIL